MDKDAAACMGCMIVLVIWAAIGLLITWGIEWAWNFLIAGVFHGPIINYTEACALYLLLSVVGRAIRNVRSS